eukprot:superscaffoldBa00000178_g2445
MAWQERELSIDSALKKFDRALADGGRMNRKMDEGQAVSGRRETASGISSSGSGTALRRPPTETRPAQAGEGYFTQGERDGKG